MTDITIIVAAIAGLGSFFAPCILPVIPAFLAYISGTTITEIQKNDSVLSTATVRLNILANTVFFVLGFSMMFSVFGVILNSILSSTAVGFTNTLNQIGGIIIIGFGIFMILSSKIIRLNVEKKIFPRVTKASYPLSFVFGLAFATSWTPCIGPVLGSILTLAATTPGNAFVLLLAYSLGLGIPFILMGLFFSKMTRFIKLFTKNLRFYSVIVGMFIIILGVLVLTNQLAAIASFPILNNALLG